jgi:hypothetical protein
MKHLLKLLCLFFIFKSFRFFNLVLPLRINQLVQLMRILMRPFGFHDVEVFVLKDLIGRQWLFGLLFRLELIDLILVELDLHLILVAQVAEVLRVIVDYQLGVSIHTRRPFVLLLGLQLVSIWIQHRDRWRLKQVL